MSEGFICSGRPSLLLVPVKWEKDPLEPDFNISQLFTLFFCFGGNPRGIPFFELHPSICPELLN
jgi:hypothetical protein